MNPRLLFHNVYALGTVTASSTASGYLASNITDWRPGAAFSWKANVTTSPATLSVTVASTSVDTIFIAGHNLGSQGKDVTVSLTSPSSVSIGTIASTWGTKYWMAGFSTATGTTFTLSLAASGGFASAPQIGVVVLGKALEMPMGIQQGHDLKGWRPEREESFSETGFPLGANFTSSRRRLSLEWPEPGFSNSEFWTKSFPNFDVDFRAHAAQNPFAFGYDLAVDNVGLFCLLRSAAQPFGITHSYRTLVLEADVHEPI
jgi:hypothetical protein